MEESLYNDRLHILCRKYDIEIRSYYKSNGYLNIYCKYYDIVNDTDEEFNIDNFDLLLTDIKNGLE